MSTGLLDSRPVKSAFEDNEEDLDQLTSGINLLIYGMIGWLSFVTVLTVLVFTAITVKLSRTARQLDEIEFGNADGSSAPHAKAATQAPPANGKQQKRRPRPLGSNEVLRNRRRQQQAASGDDVSPAERIRGGVSNGVQGHGPGNLRGGTNGPGCAEGAGTEPLAVTWFW